MAFTGFLGELPQVSWQIGARRDRRVSGQSKPAKTAANKVVSPMDDSQRSHPDALSLEVLRNFGFFMLHLETPQHAVIVCLYPGEILHDVRRASQTKCK